MANRKTAKKKRLKEQKSIWANATMLREEKAQH